MMKSAKILITGGAGFIGSHLVEHFQGRVEKILVLDNLRTGYRHNLNGFEHTFIEGSITHRERVKKAVEGVDYIFHMAAMVSVPESMEKTSECFDINEQGLLNVLEEASEAGVKKVILASSAAVYGDNPSTPKMETMPPDPKSPYALSKQIGERYLEMFHADEKLATASLRFFNVFGPRQDPQVAYAAVVPIFMEKATRDEPLTIYGDGEQTRDFIYVKDIVGALAYAATHDHIHGTYNASYDKQMTINTLAQQIIQAAGSHSEILHLNERDGDVRHSRASSKKLRAAGWKPQYNLQDGIAATLTFFQNSQTDKDSL